MRRVPVCLLAALAAGAAWPGLPASADAASGLWARRAELLTVDAAFRLDGARIEHGAVVVSWSIAGGYYLYRDRLHFRATLPAGAVLQAPMLPEPARVEEPGHGAAAVYRNALQARLGWPAAAPAPRRIAVSYQGCADAGFCYPPQTRLIEVIQASP
ncbi:MAG: protein-disulfide reductase DsbD N-terminal domain-containing protein [Nevskia sp.]|nr:protein-disulfide reductase DsbD N-terminal domain-containing protein [Nevskia sp.]